MHYPRISGSTDQAQARCHSLLASNFSVKSHLQIVCLSSQQRCRGAIYACRMSKKLIHDYISSRLGYHTFSLLLLKKYIKGVQIIKILLPVSWSKPEEKGEHMNVLFSWTSHGSPYLPESKWLRTSLHRRPPDVLGAVTFAHVHRCWTVRCSEPHTEEKNWMFPVDVRLLVLWKARLQLSTYLFNFWIFTSAHI